MKRLFCLLLTLGLLHGAPAQAGSSLPPPAPLPVALQSVGAPRRCPIILLESGQSNRVGFDTGGSKTVQAGVFITNAVAQAGSPGTPQTPTAIIPAAFGTAPLNLGLGSLNVTTAAAAYNNSAVWYANDLVTQGNIPAGGANGEKVVIAGNWFGGQPISQWVGSTPGTMNTSAVYWQALVAQMTLVQATYPGCPLTEWDWDQGEADSTATATGYNTAATYAQGFQTLLTAMKGLTINGQAMWNTDPTKGDVTKFTLQELATWQDNYGANARNDVIDIYRGGRIDPAGDVIPVDGLTESLQNAGPHFDGPSLIAIGQRLFNNYQHARVAGAFGDRANTFTSSGSADAYPNVINGPATNVFAGTGTVTTTGLLTITAVSNGTIVPGATISGTGVQANVTVQAYGTAVGGTATTGTGGVGTYATSVGVAANTASEAISVYNLLAYADLRSGALIYGNGGTIALPPPSLFALRPVTITFIPKTTTNIDTSAAGGQLLLTTYNNTLTTASGTTPGSEYTLTVGYSASTGSYVWKLQGSAPLTGNLARYAPGVFGTGTAQTLGPGNLRYALFLTNNNALTIGPSAGGSFVVCNAPTAAGNTTIALGATYISNGNVIQSMDGTTSQSAYPVVPGGCVFAETDGSSNTKIVNDTGRPQSIAEGLTAAGTTLGTALALTADYDAITTVASGTGVSLRAVPLGRAQEVMNAGANALAVYPPSAGAAIQAGAGAGTAGAAVTLASGAHATFRCTTSTLCRQSP